MERYSPASTVTATRLVRDLPEIRRIAEHGPVHITSHGRTELVLVTPEVLAKMNASEPTGLADAARLDAKLSGVLDAIESAVVILDEDMRIRRFNQAFVEMFNTESDDLIGRSISDMARTPNGQFIVQHVQEVIRSKFGETLNMPAADQIDRQISIVMRPWQGGAIVVTTDITEKVKSQDQAMSRIAFEQGQAMLGGLGHVLVQSCGTIVWASQGLADMCGSTKDAMVGSRVQRIFDPGNRESVETALTSQSTKPKLLPARFLLSGTKMVPVQLAISSYWSREHHACAAIVIKIADEPH